MCIYLLFYFKHQLIVNVTTPRRKATGRGVSPERTCADRMLQNTGATLQCAQAWIR